MYYTYILQSKKDGKWYTGATSDLRKRLIEHNDGKVPSTKSRGPFKIIYYESCLEENDAFAREKFLKTGMGKRYLKNRLKRFLFLTGQVKKGARPVRGKTPLASADVLRRRTSNGGFVALITAIILSIILITVTVALNRIGFLTRSEISDAEYKNRSSALAEACVDAALLNLVIDPTYPFPLPQQLSVGTDSCRIRSVTTTGTQNTIETRAVFPDTATNQGATTNLRITVNASDLSVISWDEIPSF